MTIQVLQIHWGFLLGGGGRYARTFERLHELAPIKSHCICILGQQWQTDRASLASIDHSVIPIQNRLDRTWVNLVKDVIGLHRPDLIMTHGFNSHFVAWCCQRRMGRKLPLVSSYHGPYHPANAIKTIPGLGYDKFTHHYLKHHALAVVAVAHHAKRRLVARGVPGGRVDVIHNGIPAHKQASDGVRQEFRRRWGIEESAFLIGAVGRLDPIKGFHHLLAPLATVLPQLPNIRLAIIGDGPQRTSLQSQVDYLGVTRQVRLTGPLDDAAVVLPAFDAFVLPSHSECHSIALLEAMRAGLPIIATGVGGNTETILHEYEGLLVPPGKTAPMAEAIVQMAKSPDLCLSLGERARQRFLREFTEEIMLQRTANWLLRNAAVARMSGLTV